MDKSVGIAMCSEVMPDLPACMYTGSQHLYAKKSSNRLLVVIHPRESVGNLDLIRRL